MSLRVASLERTLVDVLNRHRYSGGWEEVWRSLESVEFFDLDRVVEYALLLDNATTVARVGFFLEQHRDTLMVDEAPPGLPPSPPARADTLPGPRETRWQTGPHVEPGGADRCPGALLG